MKYDFQTEYNEKSLTTAREVCIVLVRAQVIRG